MELLCMVGYFFNLLWILLAKIGYGLMCFVVFLFRVIGDKIKKAK